MNRMSTRATLAGLVVGALASGIPQASADVIYSWHTLTATVDGAPTSLTASGQIVLTDGGFSAGSVSVTTTDVPFSQTLDGVVSASFKAFDGPTLSTGGSFVNFTATVDGQFLDVNPINDAVPGHPGFFVNSDDTEAYFGENGPGPHVLTIGYGTDNQFSVCYGSQLPNQSHCVVTGFFQLAQVPEPGSLAILATAFSAFGVLCFALRRNDGLAEAI